MKSSMPADMLMQETPQQQMENHPVIRTLYDHTAVGVLVTRLLLFLIRSFNGRTELSACLLRCLHIPFG